MNFDYVVHLVTRLIRGILIAKFYIHNAYSNVQITYAIRNGLKWNFALTLPNHLDYCLDYIFLIQLRT